MNTQPDGGPAVLKFILSQASLAELARASRLKRVLKGSFLFFQSDPATAVYLVRQGAVAILPENIDGRALVMSEMSPGDCFGELGILTGQTHSASAEAIVNSEILVIPRAVFLAVLKQEPGQALRLLEITARRLLSCSRREEALAFQDAQQRLARLLLALNSPASAKGYLSLSQEELAQRAGLTRQTVAAILGRWRRKGWRKGWLLTGRGHLVLLNHCELNLLIQDLKPLVKCKVTSSSRQTGE